EPRDQSPWQRRVPIETQQRAQLRHLVILEDRKWMVARRDQRRLRPRGPGLIHEIESHDRPAGVEPGASTVLDCEDDAVVWQYAPQIQPDGHIALLREVERTEHLLAAREPKLTNEECGRQ